MASVILRQVSKTFGDNAAVDAVSLDIKSGEFITLLGPSGCGKTTTLRMIAGLVTPDSGHVSIAGADVTHKPSYQRNIGMVFQSHALFPHMNIIDNVGFGLRMRGVDRATRKEKVARALDLVRLSEFGERYPSQLSGGQQQRVALARALVFDPHVLLLDEPFGALDRKLREILQVELRQLTRRIGITSVFVTHDQEEALILSDRVAVMKSGRLEQVGSSAEIFARPATRFVADFMGAGNILEATVINIAGGRAILEVEKLRLEAPADRALSPGQPVVIALRAEWIRLAAAGDAGVNSAAGSIEEVVYHGAQSTYRLQLESLKAQQLHVREPELAGGRQRFVSGARVHASWPTEAVQILGD